MRLRRVQGQEHAHAAEGSMFLFISFSDDDVWLVGPGPEGATKPGVLQEHRGDGPDQHSDGTAVGPQGRLETGCCGARLMIHWLIKQYEEDGFPETNFQFSLLLDK